MKIQKTLLTLAILITSLSFGQTTTFPATGNVGIGTTTDNNVDKLQVNGSILSEGSISSQGLTYSKSLLYTGDLNNLIVSGFYNGENLANAPTTGWFYYDIQRFSGNNDWVKQTATGFGSSFTTGTYVRNKTNLGWQPWRILWDNGNLTNLNQFTNNLTNINAYDNNGGPNTYEYNKLSVGINFGISEFNGSEANAITVMGRNSSYYGWQLIGDNTPWGASDWYLRRGKGNSPSWNQMYKIWHSGNLTTPIQGTLTSGYIPKATGTGTLGNSLIYDNGNVGIGTTSPSEKLAVNGNALFSTGNDSTVFAKFSNNRLRVGYLNSVTPLPTNLQDAQIVMKGGGSENLFIASRGNAKSSITFHTSPGSNIVERMKITSDGNVGIGSANPDQKLTVKGKIHAEEIIVDLNVPADYVFQKYYTGKSELKSDYVMPTLAEIESFTKKNNHLPNVPSAKEVQEKGLSLGEMSNILLQKVEELTLYAIEQNKVIEELKAQVATLIDKKH